MMSAGIAPAAPNVLAIGAQIMRFPALPKSWPKKQNSTDL
jgi:hypothetical protein